MRDLCQFRTDDEGEICHSSGRLPARTGVYPYAALHIVGWIFAFGLFVVGVILAATVSS